MASTLEKITFGSGLPGYEAGDKTAPAVIVVQEWWGITNIVKEQAALLAKAGFRVLIPDLYKGKIGVTAEEAHHLMDNLDFPGAVSEIGQALQYLKETGSPKVGITGFCMGGALSLAAASKIQGLECTAPCYGIPPSGEQGFPIETIKIPILGTYGGNDKHKGFADADSARALEDKIKAAGGNMDLHIYPTGVHGFLNQLIKPEGVELVQKEQGALASDEDVQAAWDNLVAFLNKHLKA